MPQTIKRASKKVNLNTDLANIFESFDLAVLKLSAEQQQALGVPAEVHTKKGIIPLALSKAHQLGIILFFRNTK